MVLSLLATQILSGKGWKCTDSLTLSRFLTFQSHKKMDESWQVPLLDPEDVVNFQIQANLWRRVMAHQGTVLSFWFITTVIWLNCKDSREIARKQKTSSNYWKVSEKVWRLEFHEATDAFRGFFFQVAFQVNSYFCFSALPMKNSGPWRFAEFRVHIWSAGYSD